jgi:hypothetical protein
MTGTGAIMQWFSTWGMRTPGGTRKHLGGYVKFKKIYIYYFMINTEYSGPDLGLATEDPDIRTFCLRAPFLLALSLSPL